MRFDGNFNDREDQKTATKKVHYDVANIDQGCICPVCFSLKNTSFLSIYGIPVLSNAVYSSRDEAIQARRGDMQLVACRVCGHIYNAAFDPDLVDYNQEYENTLFFSPFFCNYAESLAEELIERRNLFQKDIIVIGCGRGNFLELLVKKGNNRGVGFDPSLVLDNIENNMPDKISYIKDYYTTDYAHLPVDLIVCRHVLEHVYNLRDFLKKITQVIGDRQPFLYFEVPNVMDHFRNQNIWDIIYEHYSYFSQHSLAELFFQCGFKVLSLDERFGGQFLTLEALPESSQTKSECNFFSGGNNIFALAVKFAETFRDKVDNWRDNFAGFLQSGQKVIIWGTGSKGVNFLNLVDKDGVVEYAIDINPFKHGNFVGGTGQKIMPPEFLCDYKPDKVIVINPIYLEEIRKQIENLEVQAELICS